MGASSVEVGRQHAHRAILQVGKAACSKTCPADGRVKLLLEEWPKRFSRVKAAWLQIDDIRAGKF